MNVNINIIWENKGIALGIIMYLLNNFDKLVKKKIIIDNDKIRLVLKELFYDFKFKKISKEKNNEFKIIIKNNSDKGDLIINNLNNIDKIHATKVKLLPWYDKDNPIILFRYKDDKAYNVDKLRDKIYKFSKKSRFRTYGKLNFIEGICNLRLWDTFMEHRILEQYTDEYPEDIRKTYFFITTQLGGLYCAPRKREIIQTPVPIPVKVPVEVGIPIPIIVKKEVRVPVKEKCDHSHYDQLIGLVTKKIQAVNEFLDQK